MGDKLKDIEAATTATELLVCTTCRAGRALGDDEVRPGALLHDALEKFDWPAGITVRAVECLSNCDHGCSVVIRGGGARWTYVYGNLDETLADIIHDGVTRYHATDNGLVPWRERPQHFRKNCIARIPPLEIPE